MEDLVKRDKNGKPITTSLLVAEKFGKNHSKVCRDIEALLCSDKFRVANFGEATFENSKTGQQHKMYVMTKDGFTFLVMGYTGEKAAKFKEDYIEAFNLMEDALMKVLQNQIIQAQESAKQRFIKSNRIKEIDATINHLLKERKELVKEINHIDRFDFRQLSLMFSDIEHMQPSTFPNKNNIIAI